MQVYINNASGQLKEAVSPSDTTITLLTGEGARFPLVSAGYWFLLTLFKRVGGTEQNHEIIKVTSRTGDVLTVERAQENTTAQSFNINDFVEARLTGGSLSGSLLNISEITPTEDKGPIYIKGEGPAEWNSDVSAYVPMGGGAKGGGSDKAFWVNDSIVNNDFTVEVGKNAGSFGPITIADGATVTISDGATWTIV